MSAFRATVRVSEAVPDPLRRDRLRRWLVTCDLLEVQDGEPPDDTGVLTLLLHSPSRDLRDADPVGSVVRLSLADPPIQPYLGSFTVEPA